jgi:hypothetical protein
MVVTFLNKVKGKFKVVPVRTRKTHNGTRNTVLSLLTLAQNGLLSHQLFEHMMLRRIFGPKTEEGTRV